MEVTNYMNSKVHLSLNKQYTTQSLIENFVNGISSISSTARFFFSFFFTDSRLVNILFPKKSAVTPNPSGLFRNYTSFSTIISTAWKNSSSVGAGGNVK